MLEENVQRVLDLIGPEDRVLDVGGWACPFNRADWVLDAQPHATRGYYRQIGLPAAQGGGEERFDEGTWVQRDICAKEPWPFPDRHFDFSICSQTLEDVRDPLQVCAELNRVSRRGYLEVPSRLFESIRGVEGRGFAGLSHHRWLIEIEGRHVQFTSKFHLMHGEPELALPRRWRRRLTAADCVTWLFWDGSFTYAETSLDSPAAIRDYLAEFVRRHYRYPWWQRLGWRARALGARAGEAVERRLRAPGA